MTNVKKLLKGALFIAMTLVFFSFNLPTGWHKAGTNSKGYEMGIAMGEGQDGKNAATIKSITKKRKGFGTLMQSCLPDNYLGKRVRMSGMIKTKNVSQWSGLWFRIDQEGSSECLGFDNMHDGEKDRSIKGTTEWTKCEIVLDVPMNASNLAYGALLFGKGQIWFDNIKFEIVDTSIPTTGIGSPNKEPINLEFEN